MEPLPIPPPPHIDGGAPTHGQRATCYASIPTDDIIRLLRQLEPGDDVDEAAAQRESHRRGEASYLDLMVALHERATPDVYAAAVALCRDPDPNERCLGLRILRELGDDRPVYDDAWDLLESMATTEEDLDVLWWVLSCLMYTFRPRALDTLLPFANHADPGIRGALAFGILGCSGSPTDPRVIDTQLALADDVDTHVRWLAIYDFVEEITADSPQIRTMLTRHVSDPDADVAELAAKALARREGLSP
jgi:HEAT repeat protein